MEPVTRWRPQLTMGSGKVTAVRQRPIFLPLDLHTEWDLVIRARSNLLLAGSSSATDAILVALKPHLRAPLRKYTPKTGVPLPQPREGTLILLGVDRLDGKQQAQLVRWLDRFDERGRVQVVSTTSEPIFSLVETGAFLANLYYRLNVVRMDLTASGESTL
jgi:sigma-54-interacting transcriptional regulator